MDLIFVYITIETKDQAKTLAKQLLDKKLIACANIFPIESMYFWKGNLEETSEHVLIVKTKKDYWETLKTTVTQLHPYEIPCITKMDIDTNQDYENWLCASLEK